MRLVFLTWAFSILSSGSLFAEETMEFKGWYVGASVLNYTSNTSVNSGFGYWDDRWGFTAGVGIKDYAYEIDGQSNSDFSLWGIGAGPRVAYSVADRVKTYFELGLSYGQSINEVTDVKIRQFEVAPALAIDFLAADHLILGLNIISVPWTVYGRLKQDGNEVKVTGHTFSFLNGLSMAYLF